MKRASLLRDVPILVALLVCPVGAHAATPGAELLAARRDPALGRTSHPDARSTALREWAQREAKEGNDELACEAAERYWQNELARGWRGARDLTHAPAPASLRESARFVLALSASLPVCKAAIDVAGWVDVLSATEVETLRRNLLAESYGTATSQLWSNAVAASDPVWQAWLDDRRGKDTSLPFEALARMGELGKSMLGKILDNAVARSAWREVRRVAESILAADRWHMHARLVVAVLDDLTAGRAQLPDKDLRMLLGDGAVDDGVVWRLHLVSKAAPAATGLALAMAELLRGKRLLVDAQRIVEASVRGPAYTESLRDAFRAEAALLALAMEDIAGYRAWAEVNGRLHSDYLAHEELDRVYQLSKLSPERRALVLERLAAILTPEPGLTACSLQSAWAARLAVDATIPAAVRSRAQQLLATLEPSTAKALSACLAWGGTLAECKARKEYFEALDDDEGEPPDAIPKQVQAGTGLTYRELQALGRLPGREQAKVEHAIDRSGPWAETPAMLSFEATRLLRLGKLDRLRALLADEGGRLPRGLRLGLRLSMLDVQAKRVKPEQAQAWDVNRLSRLPPFELASAPAQTDESDHESDDADAESDGSSGLVGKITQAWFRGDARQVIKQLTQVWTRVDGIDGAELAGRIYIAANALGDVRLCQRALARARSLAPGSDVAQILEAHECERRGDKAGAFLAWRDAYLADPDSQTALQSMLAAGTELAPAQTVPGASARAWVAYLLRDRPASRSILDLTDGPSAAHLRSLLSPSNQDDAFLDQPAVAGQDPETWPAWSVLRGAGRDASLEPVRKLAAYLSARQPSGDSRRLLGWCQVLLGDLDGLHVTLTQPELPGRARLSYRKTVQAVPNDDVLHLIGSLKHPPELKVRWQLFQFFDIAAREERDTPAMLASLAAKTKDDSAAWRTLACAAAGRAERAEEALGLCKEAWSTGARNETVALYLAWAVVQDPSAAARASFDAAGFFAEAAKLPSRALPGARLHQQSLYLAKMGRTEDAALAEKNAWRETGYSGSAGLLTQEFASVRWEPLLYRLRLAAAHRFPEDKTHTAIAMGGCMAGDFPLSLVHAREAVRLHSPSGPGGEDALHDLALLMRDLAEVAEVDLREKRTTAEAMSHAFVVLSSQEPSSAAKDLAMWPRSFFFLALAADGVSVAKSLSKDTVRDLERRFPNNVLMQLVIYQHYMVVGDRAAVAAMAKRLQTLAPGDARLRALALAGDDETGTLPPELQNPDAMARALAIVDVEPELAKAWVRKVSQDDGVEVFVPADATGQASLGITVARDGIRMTAARQPNLGRCEPLACMKEIVAQLGAQSMSLLWAGPVLSPLGTGARALLRSTAGLLWIELHTTSKQIHFLMAAGSAANLRAALPMLRVWRDSFRPLDTLLHSGWRDVIVDTRFGLLGDNLRAGARTALARAEGDRCPLRSALAKLSGAHQRAVLLQDLFLSSPLARDRRRVLACASGAEESSALALPALLDPETDIRDRADGLLAKRGWDWVATAKAIATLDPEQASRDHAAGERLHDELGLLQILVHLGAEQRRSLAKHLLGSGQARLRATAILAEGLLPGILSSADVLEVLGSGSVDDVQRMARAIAIPSNEQRAALQARLAAKPLSREGLALAGILARWPESETALEVQRAAGRASGLSKSQAATLAVRDLPHLLPGPEWSYARIDKPRAWLTSVDGLLRRLDLNVHSASRLWATMLREHLAPREAIKTSLDLNRAFECARSNESSGDVVCSAYATDPPTLRRALLASCGNAVDSLRVPLMTWQQADELLRVSTALPWIYLDHGGAGLDTKDDSPAECAHRRLRFGALTIDQVSLRYPERPATAAGAVQVDSFLAFAGHRVFAANSLRALQSILAGDEGPRMASLPGFAQQSEVWHDSSAFHTWSGKRGKSRSAIEESSLMFAAGDTTFKIAGRTSIRETVGQADPSALGFVLPSGAAFEIAGVQPYLSSTISLPDPSSAVRGDTTDETKPPRWLLDACDSSVLGWYPAREGRPWHDWILGCPFSPRVEQALRARKVSLPQDKQTSRWGELFLSRQKDTLFASTRAERLQGLTTVRPIRDEVFRARIDGTEAHRAFAALAGREPPNSVSRGRYTFAAGTAEIMKTASVRAWKDRRGMAFDASFEMDAQASGRPIVEGSLALAHRLGSLRLPRPIRADELHKPLSLVLGAPSLEAARRIFGMSPRNRLLARTDGKTILQVGLAAMADHPDAAATASPSELMARGGAMPAESVRLMARSIVPNPRSPGETAQTVVSWVQREMTYELVPESLDDVTLLKKRRGDCSEYAQITVALLRSLGVPAEIRGGFAVIENSLRAHAWVAYHDGKHWIEIDPTLPGGRITSGHIEASLIDALALLAIDELSVLAVE